MKKEKGKKTLLLVDGNGLVHRGYHALPELRTPEGELVNAVYGFFLVFLKALKEIRPRYVCATFDMAAPTFRHEKYEEYKAQRPKTPDELADQIPVVKEILNEFGVPIYEKEGYEADDVIATIAHKVRNKFSEIEVIIVSGDLDTLQLVGPGVKVYTLRRGMKQTILYTSQKVRQRYGFPPSLLADYRGLKGDSSDNIPGIRGIGEKTASRLLKRFGGLEKIYEGAEKGGEMKKRVRNLVLEGRDQAFFSRELARVKKDVPLDFDLEGCGWGNYDKKRVEKRFRRMGFKTLVSRLPGNRREQGGLFS